LSPIVSHLTACEASALYLYSMKKWTIATGVALATGLAAFLSPKPFVEKETPISTSYDGAFALIELFTSQGCSSCPAADHLLNSIIEQAAINGDPVFGLSFHVSYWDYLGWKDPYASSAYNVRQGNYVNQLKAGNAYTPQMVVNGKVEFVGSSRKEADSAIKTALAKLVGYSLKVSVVNNVGELLIKYTLDKAPNQALINIALVKKEVGRKPCCKGREQRTNTDPQKCSCGVSNGGGRNNRRSFTFLAKRF